MSTSKAFQFFTTDTQDGVDKWFPMDHFFYALYKWDPRSGLDQSQSNQVVCLDVHGGPDGTVFGISQGNSDKFETFRDYPSALRRMADIIEQHTKAQKENT